MNSTKKIRSPSFGVYIFWAAIFSTFGDHQIDAFIGDRSLHYKADGTARDVKFQIFKGSNIDDAESVSISIWHQSETKEATEKIMSHLDYSKTVYVYVHGYLEFTTNESVRTCVGALLKWGKCNTIALDWSDYSHVYFLGARSQIEPIAKAAARIVDGLVERGIPCDNVNLVGHSLGGQIVGFMGKYTKCHIRRITALDPAWPGFYNFGSDHIRSTDAKFVQVIHTDRDFIGARSKTGSADFYPNGGGRVQPGCRHYLAIPFSDEDFCHHWRSWEYWAESVLLQYNFLAVQCETWDDFINGKCKGNPTAYMGFGASSNASGEYYLITNSQSPFGKGDAGIGPN